VLEQIQVVHLCVELLPHHLAATSDRTNKLQHGKKFVLASVYGCALKAVFGKIRVIQLLPGAVAWQRLFDSAPTAFNIVGMGATFRYKFNTVIDYGMNVPLFLQITTHLIFSVQSWTLKLTLLPLL